MTPENAIICPAIIRNQGKVTRNDLALCDDAPQTPEIDPGASGAVPKWVQDVFWMVGREGRA